MIYRKGLFILLLHISFLAHTQIPVDLSGFDKKSKATVSAKGDHLDITWPVGEEESGRFSINLENEKPVFASIQMSRGQSLLEIAKDLDPVFLLTVGERDLKSQNGWNIFFDKTAYLPHQSYLAKLSKQEVKVISEGSRPGC
jgi:hypothetical protein